MTDLSFLDASAQAPVTSVLDASSIDTNLKSIKAVQASWRLPALPDEVSLDLASQPGVTSDHIQSLLYGLDSDFGGQEAQTVPLYNAPELPPFSGYDKFRAIVSGVASSRTPTVVDGNAIERWKMRAIDAGYLEAPEDGLIDNSWSPEFESLRKDMAYDDWNSKNRGDRPGAVPFSKVVEQIGKWTSPSGLLAAATDLDLWWDTGAISKETSTWGDKWREVGKSTNPFDFAKNLVDAITGPIDDIVMPIANWALLASGVGEAYNFGRIAYAGKKALAGAEAVEGLYRSSGFLKFVTRGYDAATDVKRMREASWLGTKLAKSEGAIVGGLGDAMAGWRNLQHVAPAKKFLATGMKLGIASQAEDLIPGYQGGGSFHDLAPVAEAVTWAQTNPLIVVGSGVAELFFTPYSTFRPGTFVGGTKNAVNFVGRHLGTTGGKAVAGALLGSGVGGALGDDTGDVFKGAAFGAMGLAASPGIGKGLATLAHLADETTLTAKLMPKAVGHVGDFLQRTSWKVMAGNQHLTMAFHEGMLNSLTGPELEKYNEAFNEQGFLGAFAKHFGVDEEAAGAAMAYTSVAAAIDHIASSQSGGKMGSALYHLSRNKLIAQIRSFDLDNIGAHTLDEIAMAGSRGINGEAKEFASLRARFKDDPGQALEFANSHNKNAQDTLQQLLSVESIPDLDPEVAVGIFKWNALDAAERVSVIKNYMPQVMDTFGNWPAFTSRTDEIRSLLHDGLLDDAVFDTFTLPSGLVRPTRPAKVVPVPATGSSTMQDVSQEINNLAFRTPETDITKVTGNGKLDVLARGVDPSIGRFTVMRADTADEGQVRSILAELTELQTVHKVAMEKYGTLAAATAQHGELTNLSKRQFYAIIDEVAKGTSGQKGMKQLFAYAKRKGIPMGDMKRHFDDALDTAVNDPRLTEWLGLSTIQRGAPSAGETLGAVLRGPEALKGRIGELGKKAQFTAARIDGEKLLASLGEGTPEYLKVKNHLDSLERDGYKLVHGVEFMMPQDLAHHTPIFADITRRHLNAASLGNAFKGRLPAVARAAEERRSLLVLQDELSKVGLDKSLNDQDLLNIREDLTAILRSEQAISEEARDAAAGGSWLNKRITGLKTSTTPMALADLGRTNWRRVVQELEPVYGKDAAEAAAKALRRMRNTEFKDVGLYAIEAKMRTNNQVAGALKVMSGTEHGESFMAHSTTGRKYGAIAGAIYGAQQEGDESNLTQALKGAAIGGVAGTVLQGGLSPLFQKAEKAFDASKWFQYGYLADDLAAVRDTMRFTLSPFFDISRYTEGQMLGQTAAPLRNAAGERIVMPLNMSPSKLKKDWAKATPGISKVEVDAKFKHLVSSFNAAARGDTDFSAADNMSAWFQQVGIMGFNPTHWMATAFHHLTTEGFDPRTAYELARDMHTYGTKGRSAVEQSVNFIFFPFSFQKKAIGHLAKFVSDDMSRAVVLHDALKGYEVLNEKYNLSQMWRDHIPVLEKLQQLNLFAFGLSPGRFGGINRPFIEPIMNMAANLHGKNEFVPGIFNLFNPQGVSVKSAAEAANVQKLVRSLTPVYNDINYLLGDGREQIHALTSASKQTRGADIGDGWQAWSDYTKEFKANLAKQGFTMTDLKKPYMASTKLAYEAKRAEISAQYPGWGVSRKKSAAKSQIEKMELQDRLDRVSAGTATPVDVMTFEFSQAVKAAKVEMDKHGVDEFVDADPAIRQGLIDLATRFASVNQEWRRVYGKFFGRELGPIEAEVLL